MKSITLPGTSKQASRICLGTAWFGTEIAEDRAYQLLDTFVSAGGNFLDTAHMYASWVKGGAGKSEETLGKWIKSRKPANIVLATKGADRSMSRDGIRGQLDESLKRLQLDRVDFYWLHADNTTVPVSDIIEWLNELVKENRFTAFGCSNWKIDRIAAAQEYAKSKGLRGFSASQIGWSLARVNPAVAGGGNQIFMDDATMKYHRDTGLAQVAYSSQAGGFFGGNFDPKGAPPGVTPNANIVKYYGTPDNYKRQALVNELAAKKKATPNQVALAYLISQSFPSFAIAGANSPERVLDSCGAPNVSLTAEELAKLERP